MATSQFYLYGRRHFTQTGYLKHLSTYHEPVQDRAEIQIGETGADHVDLSGRTVLITGANSGIGQQIATYCAAKNVERIVMVCRSGDKAASAKREIVDAVSGYPPSRIQIVLCDLADLSQIKAVVSAQIIDNDDIPNIDCIVCNAGVLLNEERVSNGPHQWELTFASHLLGGTYYLCQLLRPKLVSAARTAQPDQTDNGTNHPHEPRIVMVTSGGMYNTKIPHWDVMTSYGRAPDRRKVDGFTYDGNLAYAYAKRGQVVLAGAWGAAHPAVTTVAAHPGWTDTPAVDDAYGDKKRYLEPMRTPWQGAEGICWLIGTDRSNLQNGALYLDRAVQRRHLAGPFFGEGTYTKNTDDEIATFLDHLRDAVADV